MNDIILTAMNRESDSRIFVQGHSGGAVNKNVYRSVSALSIVLRPKTQIPSSIFIESRRIPLRSNRHQLGTNGKTVFVVLSTGSNDTRNRDFGAVEFSSPPISTNIHRRPREPRDGLSYLLYSIKAQVTHKLCSFVAFDAPNGKEMYS